MSEYRKLSVRIAVMAAVLILICIVHRMFLHNTFTAYIPTHKTEKENQSIKAVQDEGVPIEIRGRENHNGYIEIQLQPDAPGTSYIDFVITDGVNHVMGAYRIGKFKTVYDMSLRWHEELQPPFHRIQAGRPLPVLHTDFSAFEALRHCQEDILQ